MRCRNSCDGTNPCNGKDTPAENGVRALFLAWNRARAIPLRPAGEMVNGVGQCRKTSLPRRSRGIERQRKRYGGSRNGSGLNRVEATNSALWQMVLSGLRYSWRELQ